MNAPQRILSSPQRMRLSVENFLLLNDNGAFADYTKTELIDGDIYVMNAQYHPHANAKSRLFLAIGSRLRDIGSDLEAIVEVTVRINDDSMPEPDISLKRFRGRGPVPVEAVALVIEVSDTTRDIDLGRKVELYGAAGIPEYWIVDLNEDRVLIHWHPLADGYREQLDVPFGETLFSATVEGLSVDSTNMFD